MSDLEDKVAVVTGGGQGIGRGIARHLLREGMKVAVLEVDREAGEEAARGESLHGQARFFETDVADESSVRRAMSGVIACFGRIDALINNAGIAHPYSGSLEDLDLEVWKRVIGVNLTGVLLCAKHAARPLRECGGAIVNIASTRAFQSEPQSEAYAAAKGGVVSLSHALAASLGPKVRVNCISPGWIEVSDWKKGDPKTAEPRRAVDHAQHWAGRIGRPQDIAELVQFLISERSGFITGQNFIVDGGMTRKMIYVD